MNKDVSKQTVVVLVFLVILVSVLGTFTVLQEAGNVNVHSPHSESRAPVNTGQGEVKLYIGEKPKSMDLTTGQVILNIVHN